MWLPMGYGHPDEEYERLTTGVSMWDVAAQRHIEVAGEDADDVVQLVTVIDTSSVAVGTATYAPMADHQGRLINDPVLFHVADREWRFSIADSDIRLWVDATARAHGLDCTVTELDTATLAVQGPKSSGVMEALGLGSMNALESLHFQSTELDGLHIRVSRSGWSTQGGFEFFLDDPDGADDLWHLVADAGASLDIGPGAPNPSERIENVLLSYGTDTGYHADPYELGLGDLVDLRCGHFEGRVALEQLARRRPERRLRGLRLDGSKIEPLQQPLFVEAQGRPVGQLRAAAWSPRFGTNLGLALISSDIDLGCRLDVIGHDDVGTGVVVDLPFDDDTSAG
ncbi:glycine cleavage T C-terminal barrel domain-containing protein [Ilumatobacter sp.]|uniref:glycine cleavage T C-terminal barrel domain-containing protein n=1 Tax=Ilumatobacter sp. TaxID=1967498 RepID=UPI003C6EEF17